MTFLRDIFTLFVFCGGGGGVDGGFGRTMNAWRTNGGRRRENLANQFPDGKTIYVCVCVRISGLNVKTAH